MKKLTFWQMLNIILGSFSFNPDSTKLDEFKTENRFIHTPEYLALLYSYSSPEVQESIIAEILIYLYKADKSKLDKISKVSEILTEAGYVITIDGILNYLKDDEKILGDISDLIRKKYFSKATVDC